MKCRRTIDLSGVVMALVLALGLPHLAARASGQTPAYDLCIEQSPTAAGTVTPNSGTHRFSADSVVVLSAAPQPGYQFAYWIGDVADPASQRTTVCLNAPKIVVAVFRPADEDNFDEVRLGGGGGGGLTPTAVELGSSGWSTGGGGGRTETRTIFIPVVPTPEPATIVLLGLGTLVLRRRIR